MKGKYITYFYLYFQAFHLHLCDHVVVYYLVRPGVLFHKYDRVFSNFPSICIISLTLWSSWWSCDWGSGRWRTRKTNITWRSIRWSYYVKGIKHIVVASISQCSIKSSLQLMNGNFFFTGWSKLYVYSRS